MIDMNTVWQFENVPNRRVENVFLPNRFSIKILFQFAY